MRTRSLCLVVASLFVLVGPAGAADVTVGCTGSPAPYDYTSIQAALHALDPIGPHTITVTGICTETVNITARDRVTIQAPIGETAAIVPSTPSPNVVTISGSRNITLRRLSMQGGSSGIWIDDDSLVSVEDCEVNGAAQDGIVVRLHSTLRLTAGTLRGNPLWGLRVMQGSQATIGGRDSDGRVLIHENGNGVYCTESSACLLNGLVTIQDNWGFGLAVTRTSAGRVVGSVGSNTIRANGADGVLVNTNSTLMFQGAGYVEENGGVGFNVEQGAALIVTDTTVRNNASSGFFAVVMGYVFYSTGNEVSGNQGPAFSCDATSLLLMDAGAQFMPRDLACKNVNRENGPPRPGRFQ